MLTCASFFGKWYFNEEAGGSVTRSLLQSVRITAPAASRGEGNGPFHLVGYSSCFDAAERPRVNASAYHDPRRHAATAVVAMPAAQAPYTKSLTKRSPASRPKARKAVPTRNNRCPTRMTSDLPPRPQRS